MKFEATAGQVYKVKLAGTGLPSPRFSWVSAVLGDGTTVPLDFQTGPIASADTPFYFVAPSSQTMYVKFDPALSVVAAAPYTIAVTEYARPVPGLTDEFEPDNILADASMTTTDGAVQLHSGEGQLGQDWVGFPVKSGRYYRATLGYIGAFFASPKVDLYDASGNHLVDLGSPSGNWGLPYWRSTFDGVAYLKVWQHNGGLQGTYSLAVSEFEPASVSGTLTYGVGGGPVAGATGVIRRYAGGGWLWVASTSSDGSGDYDFPGLNPDQSPYMVSFEPTGGANPTLPVTLQLAPGASEVVNGQYYFDVDAPSSEATAPQGWQKGTVTVTMSALDVGTAGLNRIDWWTAWPNVSAYTGALAIGGVGPVVVNYHAVDNVGNVEQGPENSWNTITVYPDDAAPVTGHNAMPEYLNAATIKLSTTDQGSGVGHAWRTLDGALAEGAAATLTLTAPGTHTLKLWSEDKVSNAEETQTVGFKVHSAKLGWTSTSSVIGYKTKTVLGGTFSSATTATAGRTIRLKKSVAGGSWIDAGLSAVTGSKGAFAFSVAPDRKTAYRAYVANVPGSCLTSVLTLTPRASVGTPVVPTLRVGRASIIYGDLRPQQPASSVVYLYAYHYERGAYRYITRLRAKVTSVNGISRYVVTVKPSKSGTWRYRAYFAGSASNAAAWGGVRQVSVR